MSYIYHIQTGKEASGSTLHNCPQCGRRSFTYYVSRSGRTVNDPARGVFYGICFHRNSCGYLNYPNGVPDPDKNENYRADEQEAAAKKEIQQPPRYYSVSLLKQTLQPFRSNLLQYLQSKNLPNLQEKARQYFIGATKNGGTVFWLVDEADRIHRGKIMYYGTDGHRIKDDKGNGKVNSVRSTLQLPIATEPPICYFGSHFLPRFPDKTVGIVESEKTALICSCIFPEQIWLATGSKNNLHSKYCGALSGRNVVVYPDYDAYNEWAKKMEFIADACNITYTMDQTILQYGSEKEDLADILLKTL